MILYERPDRRLSLGSLGALALAPEAIAQAVARSPISVAAINHAKIRVSNPARSLEHLKEKDTQ